MRKHPISQLLPRFRTSTYKLVSGPLLTYKLYVHLAGIKNSPPPFRLHYMHMCAHPRHVCVCVRVFYLEMPRFIVLKIEQTKQQKQQKNVQPKKHIKAKQNRTEPNGTERNRTEPNGTERIKINQKRSVLKSVRCRA